MECINCGCTDQDCMQCIKKTGNPCYWIIPNRCSACYEVVDGDVELITA